MGTPLIDISYFEKLDIRVGKVVSAEKVTGSRKLLRLIVDIGNEERQLIAGVAEYYEPKDLIGKYVVVLANLKPKRIMGLESKGMILAADANGVPVLLTVDKEVPPGSRVK